MQDLIGKRVMYAPGALRALLHPFAHIALSVETVQPTVQSADASPLRALRLLRGWSQRDVADALQRLDIDAGLAPCAVSEDLISRWECGKRKPSPYYRKRLCVLFQVTADKLGVL